MTSSLRKHGFHINHARVTVRIAFVALLGLGALPLALGAQAIVQVREYKGAATIAVVAWSADQPLYGLRTEVRQDGSYSGDDRRGEHRLYLSSMFVKNQGGTGNAYASTGKKLRATPTKNDEMACYRGPCSPPATEGFAVPDAMLRNAKDSLGVAFDGDTGKGWTIKLRAELIASYLRVVDSVSAAAKKK